MILFVCDGLLACDHLTFLIYDFRFTIYDFRFVDFRVDTIIATISFVSFLIFKS